VGEDNKTIIHHKVAATVHCVLTPEDYAQLPIHQPPQHHLQHQNGYHPQAQQQRRPSVQQVQNPGGLGGMGGGPSLGLSGRSGKSGLTFDHILGRLQTELQKSRETGSDLHGLAGVMTDINETLAGGAAVRGISRRGCLSLSEWHLLYSPHPTIPIAYYPTCALRNPLLRNLLPTLTSPSPPFNLNSFKPSPA
jgi:hypothetical protein